jgi:hypothetical protein
MPSAEAAAAKDGAERMVRRIVASHDFGRAIRSAISVFGSGMRSSLTLSCGHVKVLPEVTIIGRHKSADEIATEAEARQANVLDTGNGTQAIQVVRAPLSRPEAFRRIGNTLKAMASDEDRRKVLSAALSLLPEA